MVKSRQHLAVQSEAPLAGEGQCTRWAQPKRHCRPRVPFHGGAVEGADAVRKGDANDTKLEKGSGVP